MNDVVEDEKTLKEKLESMNELVNRTKIDIEEITKSINELNIPDDPANSCDITCDSCQ